MYPIIVIVVVLYWFYGISFAKGITNYIRLNNCESYNGVKNSKVEDTWQTVINEWIELKEAMIKLNPWEVILEGGDVLLALIKYNIIKFLPQVIYCNIWCWLLVFPLALPTTIKLGYRYEIYGCIRNHQNSFNRNHRCSYYRS